MFQSCKLSCLLLLISLICLISTAEENENEHLFTVKTINNENITHPDAIDLHSIKLFDAKLGSKIVGGYEAKPYQFPHQAAIYIFGESGRVLFCGGSVISREYVITAAHCIFERPKRILVILGNTRLLTYNKNEVRRDVERYIIHKKYDRPSLTHDICLLQLRGVITYSRAVSPIALPRVADINRNYLNRIATVSGFGKTSDLGKTSTQLMFIELEIMDNDQCNNWFDDRDASSSNICTSGQDERGACQGDSGGPLVIDNILLFETEALKANAIGIVIGLVSFGARYCSWGYPSVYTRVPCYIKWIANYTKIPIH